MKMWDVLEALFLHHVVILLISVQTKMYAGRCTVHSQKRVRCVGTPTRLSHTKVDEGVFPQAATCGNRRWGLRWRSAWQPRGTTRCGADYMQVDVETGKDFGGVIYTRGSYHSREPPCFIDPRNGRSFSLKFPLSQCHTKLVSKRLNMKMAVLWVVAPCS
jgi:hypothetical protein